MTAEQFRSDKDLVAGLRTLLENAVLKLAMEVLAEDESENPVFSMPAPDVTPHFAHIQSGQQIGWAQYPKRLLRLATHPPVQTESNPETDYEQEPE